MRLQDVIWAQLREVARKFRKKIGSKYQPHQGEKEKARRQRQIEKGIIRSNV